MTTVIYIYSFSQVNLKLKTQLSEERAKIIHDLQEKLASCEKEVQEGELIRRKLHNTVQELKGNIRVFCRLRPLLTSESESETCQFNFSDDHQLSVDLGPTEVGSSKI